MSDLDDKLLLELADESRREFLKKLGKGVAMATSGIKPDLSAVKKVDYLSKPVIGHAPYDRDFDSYDAISFALDNMFEFGRAESDLSMPMKLQQQLGNKLQFAIIGHKYASSPGGPSSLRPTDYDFYSSLMDNADEYGDMDEAISSTSATLQDVFDYPKIFKGADSIWKEKGMEGLDDIEKYIKDNVEGYINADKEGETGYEGEPEPVDEDPRDYLERDYASGPHMNSFKPELSFKQFYLTEGSPGHPLGSKGNIERRGQPMNVPFGMPTSQGKAISHMVQDLGFGNVTAPSEEVKQKYLGWAFKVNEPLIVTPEGAIDVLSSKYGVTLTNVARLKQESDDDGQEWNRGTGTEIYRLKRDGTPTIDQPRRAIPAGAEGEITGYVNRDGKYQVVVDFVEPSGKKYTVHAWIGRIIKDKPFHASGAIEWI